MPGREDKRADGNQSQSRSGRRLFGKIFGSMCGVLSNTRFGYGGIGEERVTSG